MDKTFYSNAFSMRYKSRIPLGWRSGAEGAVSGLVIFWNLGAAHWNDARVCGASNAAPVCCSVWFGVPLCS
jgi:hypothetical protein